MADTSTRRSTRQPAESTDDPRGLSPAQAQARARNQAGAQARLEARAQARAGQSGRAGGSTVAAPDQDWRAHTSSLEPVVDDRPGSRGDEPTSRRTVPAARPRPRGPRRARLRLTRVDPWSVMKTSFLLSIAFAVVTIVAVAIVWTVLDAAGVWESINASVEVVVGEDSQGFDVEDFVGMTRVLGFTMLVAVLDVILITAIATLGAFLYNMSAALLGGVEVTLAEDPR